MSNTPGNSTEGPQGSNSSAGPMSVEKRGPFYALRFYNFRLFFYGQLISVAGTWMQNVAQNWLVWDVTHQPRWLGIVNGASALPYAVFAMWGGNVADRYSKRAVLVWTQSLAMVLAFVLAALATGRWVTLQGWHIAVLAALLGIVNAFNMPAQQAFVTDLVEEREAMSNAIALNSLRFNIARVLGPIFAGEVLFRGGAALCFSLNGISYIAVVISLLMMRLPRFTPTQRRLEMTEGIKYLWNEHALLRVILLVGAASFFAWSVNILFPMYADHFHRGARGYSNIMAVQGIGAVLGAGLLAARAERLDRNIAVYGGGALFTVILLLVAVAGSFNMLLLWLGIAGFAMIIFGMSAQIKVQEEVPDILRGRVLAIYSLIFQGLNPLGGIEISHLAQSKLHSSLWHHKEAGAQIATGINALICLAILAAMLLWHRSDRKHRY